MDPVKPTPEIALSRQWRELALVVSVAFAAPIVGAIRILIDGARTVRLLPLDYMTGAAGMATSLALLAYVQGQRRARLRGLLRGFRYLDLPIAVGVAVVASAFGNLARLGVALGYQHWVGPIPAPRPFPSPLPLGFSVWPLLYLVVAVFFEELIGRAFVIDEVSHLTGRPLLAAFASALLGASYHLYEGALTAIAVFGSFLVFSLYYARTRRLWPVILAHFLLDGVAWVLISRPLVR